MSTVIVYVTDINDNKPIFSSDSYVMNMMSSGKPALCACHAVRFLRVKVEQRGRIKTETPTCG